MFEFLDLNYKRIYPAIVVSTMSSGKSTLINALLGQDILPSGNTACTAKAISILDNDLKEQFIAHTVDSSGKYKIIKVANKKDIIDFNLSNNISEILLEGQIGGIYNNKKSLLLIDTPGINNSLDKSHTVKTRDLIGNFSEEGLFLYVINSTQPQTYDDKEFLSFISNILSKNDNFKIIFIANKMDNYNPEKEPPSAYIENCKKYIEACKINDPIIISVSSAAALIFKRILHGETLTRKETIDFALYYEQFKSTDYSLTNYSYIPSYGNMEEILNIDEKKYKKYQIYSALYNTGICRLENEINKALTVSSKVKSPKIHYKKQRGAKKNDC